MSVANPQQSTIPLLSIFLLVVLLDRTLAIGSKSDPSSIIIMSGERDSAIRIVFSDVDGTLVHYPDAKMMDDDDDSLRLPPSATGLRGIISAATLTKCREIRDRGVKLVLVSGMRTSTLRKRLPFLPRADAYCSEGGGRIFLPIPADESPPNGHRVTPESYRGAEQHLIPFDIVEDREWRRRMQDPGAAGVDGYPSSELELDSPIPLEERGGKLWELARQLVARGYVLDTEGYATCFRVNRNQQTQVSDDDFDALLRGKVVPCPPELGTSVNLGCIDYYPAQSGKKNCCQYLAAKFLDAPPASPDLLSAHCVCLCDDDNDLEMALACQHAFVPAISSDTMANVMKRHPDHFSATATVGHENDGIQGTRATERALSLVLERIAKG